MYNISHVREPLIKFTHHLFAFKMTVFTTVVIIIPFHGALTPT